MRVLKKLQSLINRRTTIVVWFSPISLRHRVSLMAVGVLVVAIYGIGELMPQVDSAERSRRLAGNRVIFVKAGSSGNGKSWDQALGDLRTALRSAKKGDQIWVAAGEYRPTTDGDRQASFILSEQVSLFGGFAGVEQELNQRDPVKNLTVLSGEIGSPTDLEDNSYTIVYADNVSDQTIVDGFTIRGGRADGVAQGVDKSTCGGAWFNHNASPTIRNCHFTGNNARAGGAIYNFSGKNGTASPRITACTFTDNQADLDGGGLYNNGDGGTCKPMLKNCIFQNNIATYGGCIMNRARHGMTLVIVLQSEFYENKALVKGSVIYNHRDNTGICQAKVEDCTFVGNHATVGRDIDGITKR